jgi:hypothetical protein
MLQNGIKIKKTRFFLHHKFLHRNLVPQFNSFPKKFFERIVFIKTSGETGSTKLGQPATKIAQGANSCQINNLEI